MPRTYTCSFCGKLFLQNKGIMYVKNDGAILRFCSSKCRRCLLYLKRDPRKLKWTKAYIKKSPKVMDKNMV